MHLNVLHWGRHLHPAESFWSKNLSQESWIDHGEWFPQRIINILTVHRVKTIFLVFKVNSGENSDPQS